jgi:hypothetical protein
MRQTLLILIIALLAGSAQAEWVPLGRSEGFRAYLDRKSISKNGDFAQIWQLMDFTTSQWADAQTVVWSIKNLIEYDCSQPRSRTLVGEAHSEQMGTGPIVAKDLLPDPQWEDIEPGSAAQKARQIACGKW